MSLTCYCDDGMDCEWYYLESTDFSTLKTKRRKRCSSCKKLIDVGSDVVEFDRFRYPKNDIEERIYGESGEIELAPLYHCEECGGLYLALAERGYCIDILDNMRELALEQAQIEQAPRPSPRPYDTEAK